MHNECLATASGGKVVWWAKMSNLTLLLIYKEKAVIMCAGEVLSRHISDKSLIVMLT